VSFSLGRERESVSQSVRKAVAMGRWQPCLQPGNRNLQPGTKQEASKAIHREKEEEEVT
jgi:hypothetical protein